ncbi:DUF3179 domain-containing (seleno)protein [Salinigranum sp. GCM10025319]|uniref:DUF3179 domain-containing (seleno)protein n=1 Tax=Salinigranum sp. GCM10025319 TaxID=3252687 RepID=UPI00361A3DB3
MRRRAPTTRRGILAVLAASAVGALAGCSAGSATRDEATATETTTAAERATHTPAPDRGSFTAEGTPVPPEERDSLAEWGFPSTICQAEIREDVSIRAIVEPAYADSWDGLDVDDRYRTGFGVGDDLTDDSVVIGVTSAAGDRARAYPLSVVWWHEVVNDAFGAGPVHRADSDDTSDRPLLVTYCPICQSGLVAERRVGGAETAFGVTGQLWQPPRIYAESATADGRVFGANGAGAAEPRNSGNLVLYDERTRSYWSQFLARAICGEREGDRLTVLPSTVTTWTAWRDDHPETDVLLPPPYSTVM